MCSRSVRRSSSNWSRSAWCIAWRDWPTRACLTGTPAISGCFTAAVSAIRLRPRGRWSIRSTNSNGCFPMPNGAFWARARPNSRWLEGRGDGLRHRPRRLRRQHLPAERLSGEAQPRTRTRGARDHRGSRLRGGHPGRSQTNLSVASCDLTFKSPQKRQVRSGRLADHTCLMQAFRFATSIGSSAHTAHKASEPFQPVWTRGPNLPSNLPITNQRETMCSCSTSQRMPFIPAPKKRDWRKTARL